MSMKQRYEPSNFIDLVRDNKTGKLLDLTDLMNICNKYEHDIEVLTGFWKTVNKELTTEQETKGGKINNEI